MNAEPMRYITSRLSRGEDNLALDEACLLEADDGRMGETLRVWEFVDPTVVLGRSSKVELEVDQRYCRSRGVPVLRRCTGGAAVVGGPGCLMYSVVLSFDRRPALQKIDQAHKFVMARVQAAIARQQPSIEYQGICDLTYGNRKCSGNSLRVSKRHLLYHGTVLYGANLDLIAGCLRHAPRQPDYREGRDHRDFLTNISIDRRRLTSDLKTEFEATDADDFRLPWERIGELCRQRYDDRRWHRRH